MASSSISLIKESYQYDVFLSFSGEDTRKNFVDHLYEALQQRGIHTFKDDERLKQGESINEQLLKSIEDSKLFIIVFSKKYASSSWCLNELVKIMECQKSKKQIAYPVFYDADPSDVRKQRGPVGEALAKHTNKDTEKWREALTEAANLSGWDLRNLADGREAKVIKLIVEQISLELRSTNVNLDDNLVGMEPRLQELQKSFDIISDEVRVIGIKGMGGAGKTTLAKAAFDRMSIYFDAKSFVENVREVSKASLSGLLSLQTKILSDLLNGQGNNVSSVHEGTNMMKTRLRSRKVLVVLDDVDSKDQLDALAGDLNWFKPGSRIIITTRDEQVLIAHKVKWIHDVSLLSDTEAIGLFSRHAFGKDIPVQEYEELSLQVVRYAAGLPLTIKVLGSFLCGKDKLEWIDALARLKTIPLKETLEKLKLSFESLEDDYKEIFLNVACLLKGWEKNKAIRMLESFRLHATNGLKVLEQRSLITFEFGSPHAFDDSFNFVYLGMHDHIEEMGKNIVRHLHPDDPNKHSRMWVQEEIEDVMRNESGTEETRYLKLNLTPEVVLKGLGNMKNLRCLIIDHRENDEDYEDLVKIDELSQYFSNKLRYLKWHSYPHCCLPGAFRANNLVVLDMVGSNIEKLWLRGKVMAKLQFIDLSSSMLRTLDLGFTPNLVRLDLANCYDLVELHVPVGCLKNLVYLDLSYNKRLKSVLFIKGLTSLEVLNLNVLDMKEFPDIIPGYSNSSLQRLSFCENDIENLPSSIGSLHKLVYMYLYGCTKLKSLPRSIYSLKHLRVLDLKSCGIEELQEDIGQLECLEHIDLSYTKVIRLPNSICMLKHLKRILLSMCEFLNELPEDLGKLESLEKIDLKYCKIRVIPSNIGNLKHLKELDISYCSQLQKLPENLGGLKCLERLILSGTPIREIPSNICVLEHLKELLLNGCLELKKLPENIGDLKCLESLYLQSTLIKEIPSSICRLKHLKEFDLSFCFELEKLPENLGELKCLKRLEMQGTSIREIPSSYFKLKYLSELNISDCSKLKELPENIGNLKWLESLNLRSTLIREIPSGICQLKHLKELDLSVCRELEKLPENLGELECLEKLKIRGSSIRGIPSSICKLKHLKELNLSECFKLEKLPENIGDLKWLESLNPWRSLIREIPSSICKLKHLKELDLHECIELKKLPENIGDLTCLKKLNLMNTLIREIPSSICKLKHLKQLDLSFCSELKKLPENLGDLECLEYLNLEGTSISILPRSISLLKGLTIVGYEEKD